MKSLVLALLLVLFTTPAFAKDVTFLACTADHKEVVLLTDLVDDVSDKVTADIDKAFKTAAKNLSAEDLSGSVGFKAFGEALTDEDKGAINSIAGPPHVVGDCK